MTFKLELEDIEVTRIIYELRRNARAYKYANELHHMENCLLTAARIENQENAQYVCQEQCQEKSTV